MKIAILTEEQAIENLDFPITIKVYESGSQLKPTSATLAIRDDQGAAVVTGTGTVDSSTGTITYTLLAANTNALWENAVIDLTYVISSATYKATFLFDVVLQQLVNSVTDDDLKNYMPDLADDLWATETTYSRMIDEAFRQVKRDIKDRGQRPSMIMDGMQVRELVITKTFQNIFFSFAKNTTDVWWARYREFESLYQSRLDGLLIKYDTNEDGIISPMERAMEVGGIRLVR